MMHPLSDVFVRTEADYRIQRIGRQFGRSRRTPDPVAAPINLPRQRTTGSTRPSQAHAGRPAA